MSNGDLESWGWRIPFFVGAALAGAVWLARSTMEESPDFERQQAEGTVPENPLRHALSRQWRGVLRAFAISALGSITYYVGITYVPAFLTSAGSTGEADALWLSTIAAVAVILVTPLVGLLSDRVGRKPVLLVSGHVQRRTSRSDVLRHGRRSRLAGAVRRRRAGARRGRGKCRGGSGDGRAIHWRGARQRPRPGRDDGYGDFGGLTPWLAQLLIDRTGRPEVPGLMIAGVALCVLPVFITMRETAPLKMRALRD